MLKAVAEEEDGKMNDYLIAAVRTWALRQRPDTPKIRDIQASIKVANS